MRLLIALALVALPSCASGESELFPFTIRLTPQGEETIVLSGVRFDYNFNTCGTMTGTCSTASIFFHPSVKGGFTGTPLMIWSANNIPVTNGHLNPGTYPFNDISTYDIFAQFQSDDGTWRPEQGGSFTVTTATDTRLAGSFSFHGVEGQDRQPPMDIEVSFDLEIPN